ncbi:MAG: hypothetical protein V3V91_07890 [Thermoplasmata archaeon]
MVPKPMERKWRAHFEGLARLASLILFLTAVIILPLILISDSHCMHANYQALRSIITSAVVTMAGLEVLALLMASYYLRSVRIRFFAASAFFSLCVALVFALVFGRCAWIAT